MKTAHTNKGNLCLERPEIRIFNIVDIKFIEPKIEEAPAICNENITISTEAPE
jgi:hypothetical protein